MEATILTIGDELLIGQIIDSNRVWLARELNISGIRVRQSRTVGDDVGAIQSALKQTIHTSDIVVVTGGLGPTPDDVTVEAVAALFGKALVTNVSVLEKVRTRFRERGKLLSRISERVARVPEGFEVLPNSAGSAPGLWFKYEQKGRRCMIVLVPGVPREMKAIFQSHIVPRLQQYRKGGLVEHRTLATVGIGESQLQERMGDLSALLDENIQLASLPGSFQVRLRLSAYGTDSALLRGRLDRLEKHLHAVIGPYVYSSIDETIEAAVGRILTERQLTLAVAESCTGGLVLHRMTNTPGSSAYIKGGVVAYNNTVKVHTLGVAPEVLTRRGAVSKQVAIQMAHGVRCRLNADVGLSTTGVAGPSGGTPDKPVGTVWVGFSLNGRQGACHYRFGTDRVTNKTRAAVASVDVLRRELLGLFRQNYGL